MGRKRRKTAKGGGERPAASEEPETPVSETPEQEEDDDLLPILEAMLFAAHEPLSVGRIASALGSVRRSRVQAAVDRLKELFRERGSPLQLVEMAGGLRLMTSPEYAPFLARLLHKAEKERLSPAALETLAIIAYRQPVTRADIEAIRGVQAGPVVRMLQDRRLIRMVGRAEIIGRPQQFGTTKRFLDHFGLATLKDLPQVLGEDGRPVALFGDAPGGNGAARGAQEAPAAEANGQAAQDGNGHAATAGPEGTSGSEGTMGPEEAKQTEGAAPAE